MRIELVFDGGDKKNKIKVLFISCIHFPGHHSQWDHGKK